MQEAQRYLEADREETIQLDIGAAAKPVIANKMPSAEKAEMERFMHEKVRIFLDEPADDFSEKVVFLSVNDRPKWLRRGMEHVVERFYVESLARARQVHYKTTVGHSFNHQSGQLEPGHNIHRSPRMLYPYAIIEDSDRGLKWHRALLAQAVI